jgi:hypothetical protein
MAAKCYRSIKGLRMRVTKLDSIGRWVTGTTASAVSKGFIKIDLTDNIEDGEEYKQKNASGEQCINEKDQSVLNWIDLSVDFCEVDPELVQLITGQRLLTDFADNSVGFTKGNVPTVNFALEVWTKVAGNADDAQWIYWLLPGVTNGIIGDLTIENAPMTFNMKANTKTNPYWGVGPYNVVAQDALLTPGVLLEPVLDSEHLYNRMTEIAPPGAQCGFVAQNVPWTAYTP